jgi:hypothetical protein
MHISTNKAQPYYKLRLHSPDQVFVILWILCSCMAYNIEH